MYTLGISTARQGAAACLVSDGRPVAAVEEACLTRGTAALPLHAIAACLRAVGIALEDVDQIAWASAPHELPAPRGPALPGLGALLAPAEREVGRPPAAASATQRLAEGLWELEHTGGLRWHSVAYHLAHAAGAFLPSPFAQAAVLTLDGPGAAVSAGYALGDGPWLEGLGHVLAPHSLGLLAAQVGAHLGFSGDPEAVEAMAALGRPRYRDAFHAMVRAEAGGRYTVAVSHLEERLGPARPRGAPLEQRHYDVARSLQEALEETALALASWLHAATGAANLCLGGELALNAALCARLRDEAPFERVWAQPAAGGTGAALGAALWADARERGERGPALEHAFLGPAYGNEAVEAALRRSGLPYRHVADSAGATARLLARGRIVGWFQGHMALGPRDLGARTVLAAPGDPAVAARLSAMQGSEGLHTADTAVLEEEANAWFIGAEPSPFGLFAYDARPERALWIPGAHQADGSARVRTVGHTRDARSHALLRAFKELTGVPVLLSAPLRGRDGPIACAPEDALEAFRATPLDALAIESFLVERPGA